MPPKPATHCRSCGRELTPANRVYKSCRCRVCFRKYSMQLAAQWYERNKDRKRRTETTRKKARKAQYFDQVLATIKIRKGESNG